MSGTVSGAGASRAAPGSSRPGLQPAGRRGLSRSPRAARVEHAGQTAPWSAVWAVVACLSPRGPRGLGAHPSLCPLCPGRTGTRPTPRRSCGPRRHPTARGAVVGVSPGGGPGFSRVAQQTDRSRVPEDHVGFLLCTGAWSSRSIAVSRKRPGPSPRTFPQKEKPPCSPQSVPVAQDPCWPQGVTCRPLPRWAPPGLGAAGWILSSGIRTQVPRWLCWACGA